MLCTGPGLLDKWAAYSGRLSRECLTHVGRGSMAVPLDQPLTVIRLDELPNHLPGFLERLKVVQV